MIDPHVGLRLSIQLRKDGKTTILCWTEGESRRGAVRFPATSQVMPYGHVTGGITMKLDPVAAAYCRQFALEGPR